MRPPTNPCSVARQHVVHQNFFLVPRYRRTFHGVIIMKNIFTIIKIFLAPSTPQGEVDGTGATRGVVGVKCEGGNIYLSCFSAGAFGGGGVKPTAGAKGILKYFMGCQ